jgi:hypothetical protein
VVLAELDPAGGDLAERIVLDGWPANRRDTVPPGARHLADHLDATALTAPTSTGGARRTTGVGATDRRAEPQIRRFLAAIANVPGLAVLLGDPLVDGARHAATVVGPALGALVGEARFGTVVIDGGRWSSADPDRLAGVDVVYAVAEASSASQNHRCVAEARSLWRLLRARNPTARMVVTVVRPEWPATQLVDLYQHRPGPDEADGYRVVVVDLDGHGRRAAARLAAGRWASIDPRGLRPFAELARPIGSPSRNPPPEPRHQDRHDYAGMDDQATPAPPPQRPAARPTWPFGDPPSTRWDTGRDSRAGSRP